MKTATGTETVEGIGKEVEEGVADKAGKSGLGDSRTTVLLYSDGVVLTSKAAGGDAGLETELLELSNAGNVALGDVVPVTVATGLCVAAGLCMTGLANVSTGLLVVTGLFVTAGLLVASAD